MNTIVDMQSVFFFNNSLTKMARYTILNYKIKHAQTLSSMDFAYCLCAPINQTNNNKRI